MVGRSLPCTQTQVVEKHKARSIWWRLHQLAGLQFSLYLSFILITGTLAVLSHEIDWLLRPQMWVKPVAVADRVSWGAVSEAVQTYAPDARMLNLYEPLHPASTFDVIIRENDELRHVYVHPGTGEITGEGSWIGAQRFLRDAHRRLMIMDSIGNVRIGIVLVSLSSVYLLVTLVTSFWIYKKWWRGFLRWPKGPNPRAFTGDLHRWVGLWSLWFVLVMVYTGLWYLIEEFSGTPSMPLVSLQSTDINTTFSGSQPGNPHEALDLAIQRTLALLPDYHVERVLWPNGDSQQIQIFGRTNRALLVESAANSVWLDARTGELIQMRDPSLLNLHQRVSVSNNPLHFGIFAGYYSKIVYFLFGVLLSGLGVTGVLIYVLRMAKSAKTKPTWLFGLQQTWLSMGAARWPALLLTLCSFILAPFVL
jgi:uncharacterized iron-regulated membrane protein